MHIKVAELGMEEMEGFTKSKTDKSLQRTAQWNRYETERKLQDNTVCISKTHIHKQDNI